MLHTLENDFNYPFVYPKFRDENYPAGSSNPGRAKYYKYKGVGIDVFHVQRTNTFFQRAGNVLYYRTLGHAYKISNGKIRKAYTRTIQFLLLDIVFPIFNLFGRIFSEKGEYHFALGTPFGKRKMYKHKFFPAKQGEFEGEMFPIPNDYDLYLTMAYGDYMKVPSDEEIMAHGIHDANFKEEIINRQVQ